MNVRNVLNNDKVCRNLEVDRFSPTGQMEGCYCSKYSKQLPNAMCAMMYCCTYDMANRIGCWFELQGT